jgi:ABC-type sugar transport system permease subunit
LSHGISWQRQLEQKRSALAGCRLHDAFRNQNFGMAAASATIMLLLLLGASILNLRLLRETGTEETYNAF